LSCTVNKSAVCIKTSFAVSQIQQMVVPSLEKYENNAMHFTHSIYELVFQKTMIKDNVSSSSSPCDYEREVCNIKWTLTYPQFQPQSSYIS